MKRGQLLLGVRAHEGERKMGVVNVCLLWRYGKHPSFLKLWFFYCDNQHAMRATKKLAGFRYEIDINDRRIE